MKFGEFDFHPAARQLTRKGTPVHLSPKAFQLLELLIDQRPRALRKQELIERLWPDVVVEEANLKNLVAEIRAAVGERGANLIRTVHRYGYAFSGAIESSPAAHARLVEGSRVHRLREGENVIGRADDCMVILDFTGVSRHHAKIDVGRDQFVLEDLGSKNGTCRNEERIAAPVELHDGDRIRIGVVELTFRSSEQPESTATVRG